MSLGRELRRARLAAGMTQEALSYAAKIDRSYISQLERDLKSPTVEMLLRVCQSLNTSAAKLIESIEKETA